MREPQTVSRQCLRIYKTQRCNSSSTCVSVRNTGSVTALVEWCVCVIIRTQDFYINFIKINKEIKKLLSANNLPGLTAWLTLATQYTWPHRYTLTLATQYTNNNIIKQNSTRLIFSLLPQRNVANTYFYTPHFTNANSLEAIHVTTKSPKVTERSPKGWPFKLF